MQRCRGTLPGHDSKTNQTSKQRPSLLMTCAWGRGSSIHAALLPKSTISVVMLCNTAVCERSSSHAAKLPMLVTPC